MHNSRQKFKYVIFISVHNRGNCQLTDQPEGVDLANTRVFA